jgi:hypothetical protein
MQHLKIHPFSTQIPLIITVDEDDKLLLNSPDAEWYRILKFFPDLDFQSIGAKYYNSLYHFNKTRQKIRSKIKNHDSEDKAQAKQRLLFQRATMDKDTSVIFENDFAGPVEQIVSPNSIAPGITPDRIGGKKPKCFFAMFKSFIGASTMGFAPEPENVHGLLTSNLSFARVCGFVPQGADDIYWHRHVPGLRKIEQFDQIMTEYGLWQEAKWDQVVHTDQKGKQKTKSQSNTVKNCRCADPQNCSHPWQLADDGAGTIVKAHKKYIWGHKASILGLPLQGIPLDAVAVSDAATFDGETLYPHVCSLFDNLPELKNWIDTLLYDSAADSADLKSKVEQDLHIQLKASLNPRRKKATTSNLPRGMQKITPYGNMTCNAGFEMDYQGMRYESERFIFRAPLDENQNSVCLDCEHKPRCCPLSKKGRTVTIPFDSLPHIDPKDPPMSKRFKAMMTRRPSVERMIKRLKCDLSDDRLKKRGNAAFQAYLDKTMIAFHILLRT